MMSTADIIIAMIVVSFCAAIIVGTLVFCILHKKHEEDVEWIINMVCDNKTEVNRFYNKYQDHLVDYHIYYRKIGEDKDENLG